MTTQASSHIIWSPSLDNPSPSSSMVRPKSVDPSLLTRSVSQFANSSNRPPFSSYSSFSSQFTSNSSSHSRSSSQSGGGGAQQPWRPSLTPNPQSNSNGIQQRVRNRARSGTESSSSTSSSSQSQQQQHSMGVAPPFRPHSRLANVSSSAENSSERRPPSRHQHRKSSISSNNQVDSSKARLYQETMARYQALVREEDEKMQSKLNALNEGRSTRPSSRIGRRNSSSFFSSFPGSEKREREKEKERIVAEHERAVQEITRKMDEERKTIHREDRKRRRASSNALPPKSKLSSAQQNRGVLVEDDMTLFPLSDDLSPTGDQEEWTWRPGAETGGEFDGPGGERRRQEVRREQQAILDSIKRSGSSNNTSPTDSNSSSGGRKVRWGASSKRPHSPVIPPRPLSTIPSTSSTVPTLPPTPHTAHLLLQQQRSGSPFARAASSGPISAARMSPAISLGGGGNGGVRPPSAQNTNTNSNFSTNSSMRPASARPSSPALHHTRWIPSVGDYSADIRGSGGRGGAAAKPVQIPGRGHGGHHTHNGSIGTDAGTGDNGSVGSGSLSGSWRDWKTGSGSLKSQTLTHAQALEEREKSNANSRDNNSWGRRSMTPAPGSSTTRYANTAGGPPVPDIPRKRTLSFSSASAAAAASTVPAPTPPASTNVNSTQAAPPKVKERDFAKEKPAAKGKSAVVDDRDQDTEPAPAPLPALPSDDLVLAPASNTSLHAAPSIQRPDKGKGKAKAPPPPIPSRPMRSPFVELASGRVKSLYAQQIEDLAGQLRRELGVGA